ncbi:MAG: hypothetical protein L3K03_06395 [Thermoplasmata archaeon]|nr:hypothetical protein [Thermoplasmata archaeon]
MALAVLISIAGVGAAVPTHASTTPATGGFTPGVSPSFLGRVTWNNVNPVNDTSPSDALPIHFSGNITIQYTWKSVSAVSGNQSPPPTFTVYDARLQIFFFGFPLATRDVDVSGAVASTGGVINLSWDPTTYGYVLAGLYAITTSMLTPTGTTLWSQTFLVDASAPLLIGAALPAVLVIIVIAELYYVATAGREALHEPLKPKKGPPTGEPETTPPASAPASPGETPPATDGGAKSP